MPSCVISWNLSATCATCSRPLSVLGKQDAAHIVTRKPERPMQPVSELVAFFCATCCPVHRQTALFSEGGQL